MRKKLFVIVAFIQIWMPLCWAQTENLFIWGANDSVIHKEKFLKFMYQPDDQLNDSMNYQMYVNQVSTVFSPNRQYKCDIEICGEIDDPNFDEYEIIKIVDTENNSEIFRRYGIDELTTTRWLSRNSNDHNFYIQIPLDGNSYALIFAGWYWYPSIVPGEMIIVVVNKNVATLVYAGVAASISPNGYTLTSDSFSMDFVSDLSGMVLNEETGQFEEVGEGLSGKTKYTLYKDGSMLKIRTWQ